MKSGVFRTSAQKLSAGEYLNLIEDIDVKKNRVITFTANVEKLGTLRLGQGEVNYGGSYIELDEKEIRTYAFTREPVLYKSEEHGLDISGRITVIIGGEISAQITIFTNKGFYMLESNWMGSNGGVFAYSDGCELSDLELKWTSPDLSRPVWVFGDSYLGLTSPARFPYYILKCGFKDWLACGYPGASAQSQLPCFENLLKVGTPKIAVWCLGMNNRDNADSINAEYLASTQKFLTLCEQNDIVPIISTIPTAYKTEEDGTKTIVVENRIKNEWVRSRGVRYIDFEKAVVCAEDGLGWYDGMLSSDNVHPADLGAQALAARFMVDVPEIAWKN